VARGPLVLARDARLGQPIGDPVAALGDAGFTPLSTLDPPPGIAAVFTAGPIRLCDYASAGNSWDAASRYRVWMPLA
jgi:hypothetical protein